jgi:hypothetical protein
MVVAITTTMNIDASDLAYTAGLLDADGWISITKTRPSGKHANPRYAVYVGIQMGDKKPIEFVAALFERPVYVRKPKATRHKHYLVAWQSKKASDFLVQISPYLKGKKDQAEIAIEFQSTILCRNTQGLTVQEIQVREEYKNKLSSLKLINTPVVA